MSRARTRKQQEKQDFLKENPDLVPQPETLDLSMFELQIQVGTGPIHAQGEEGFFIPVTSQGENETPLSAHSLLGDFGSVAGVGTVTHLSFGPGGTVFGFLHDAGIEDPSVISAPGLNLQYLGISGNGFGVLSQDEYTDGGFNYLADGFDTISGNEVLLVGNSGRDSEPTDELGFNFLVEGGSGTVQLILEQDEGGPVGDRLQERFSVTVNPGDTEGSLRGSLPEFDVAFIGVTGDLEITVAGIGMTGDFGYDALV